MTETTEQAFKKHILHFSVLRRDYNRMNRLLEMGYNADDRRFTYHPDKDARNQRPDVVPPSLPGAAPIHLAVVRNDAYAVNMLLNYGADIDAISGKPYCLSPLELATISDNRRLIQVLLEEGARLPTDVTPSDTGHRDSPAFAAFMLKAKVLRWSRNDNSYLHEYCFRGYISGESIKDMVKFGLNVNGRNGFSETPLQCFVRGVYYGNESVEHANVIVDTLLSLGAKFSVNVSAPFMTALLNKRPLRVLNKIVTASEVKQNGYKVVALTAIRYSGQHDLVPILSLLVKYGANIFHKNRAGKSLLHFAIKWSSIPTIKFLVEKGLKPDSYQIRSSIESGQFKLIEFFLSQENNLPRVIPKNLLEKVTGKLLVLPLLRRVIKEFHFETYDGLMYALIGGHYDDIEESVEFLLTLGAKLNETTENGTPLTYALKCGNYRAVRKLILRHADVNLCDLEQMQLKPGLSYPLLLLYYAGFSFAEDFGSNIDVQFEVRKEISWFRNWLKARIAVDGVKFEGAEGGVVENFSPGPKVGSKSVNWLIIHDLEPLYKGDDYDYQEDNSNIYYFPKCRDCGYVWTGRDDQCQCHWAARE